MWEKMMNLDLVKLKNGRNSFPCSGSQLENKQLGDFYAIDK